MERDLVLGEKADKSVFIHLCTRPEKLGLCKEGGVSQRLYCITFLLHLCSRGLNGVSPINLVIWAMRMKEEKQVGR